MLYRTFRACQPHAVALSLLFSSRSSWCRVHIALLARGHMPIFSPLTRTRASPKRHMNTSRFTPTRSGSRPPQPSKRRVRRDTPLLFTMALVCLVQLVRSGSICKQVVAISICACINSFPRTTPGRRTGRLTALIRARTEFREPYRGA